jgi:hypothetical protein
LAGNEFSVTASLRIQPLLPRRRPGNFARTRSTRGEIEPIAIHKFNETHERTFGSDVKYGFVIDMASLQ